VREIAAGVDDAKVAARICEVFGSAVE